MAGLSSDGTGRWECSLIAALFVGLVIVIMAVWVIIAATFLRHTPASIPNADKGVDADDDDWCGSLPLCLWVGGDGVVVQHRLSIVVVVMVSSHGSASKLFTSALDTAKFPSKFYCTCVPFRVSYSTHNTPTHAHLLLLI